jgi:hypothetical protein
MFAVLYFLCVNKCDMSSFDHYYLGYCPLHGTAVISFYVDPDNKYLLVSNCCKCKQEINLIAGDEEERPKKKHKALPRARVRLKLTSTTPPTLN